jgi:hypothetical protein
VPIDPKFIDVSFPDDDKFVFGDQGFAAFGPPRAPYGESVNVIPESQWKDLAAAIQAAGGGCSQAVSRIYNQGNEGSCVANACSQAHEIIQAQKFGKENVVHLSAISLYKRIGRSPNSGAMVSDGLEEMAERGVLPLDTPENRAKFGAHVMPNTGFRTAYPAGWESTAKKFAGSEWFIIESVNELITALLNQHPVVVGRSGHSICYCDAVYQDGALLVKYVNSWGDWGEKGFGYDSSRLIRSSASWAFALRSVTVNP